MAPASAHPRVTLLLSSFNGARFLQPQLDSLLAQSLADWRLLWRDDGSTDQSVAIIEAFAAGLDGERCRRVTGPAGRLGAAGSFMALLRAAADDPATEAIAFVDQDDVWLPQKLARGAAALADAAGDRPVLYCARHILVDAGLRRLGPGAPPARRPGFPAALTQNIATGCTVMLNRAAIRLIAASRPSPAAQHDWWCYLLVAAGGGEIIQDPEPVLLYRQHGANLVGAPPSLARRAIAALGRGPGVFMAVLRQNVAALAAQPELLSAPARAEVARLEAALRGRWPSRLAALAMPGLHRQTRLETLVFRLWFLIG